MATCAYQKYYSEYIRGDLPPDLDMEFHRHLQHCRICEREIGLFYQVHTTLYNRRRPLPAGELAAAYHEALKQAYAPAPRMDAVKTLIHDLIHTSSRKLRLAEAVAVLLIGILVGWIFFYDTPPSTAPADAGTGFYGRPISKQDMEYLNYYFLASEMVLLEMVNSDMAEDDFFLEKETAQKLLIKTFLVHEVALKLNDPKMLRFLTRMELILYEISNTEQDQLAETLSSVRFIIDQAQLLAEVRELKQLLENSGTPANMPG